jgi:ParB family chromosome partitioning protein
MSKPTTKKKNPALGRGLSALLDNAGDVSSPKAETPAAGVVAMIPVSAIEANPFQPRVEFEPEGLEELASSIGIHGVIQPVTVRKMGFDNYQLISGERRTRAAMMAGLTQIPAYVRTANDQGMLEMALIENIQRRDLNAIEIALSYQRLIEECDLNQAELGDRVGKQRSTVTNYLRLLRLPDSIQKGVKEGKIGMGHARALINIENESIQETLYETTLENNLSVRDIEKLSKLPSAIIMGLASGAINYEDTQAIQSADKDVQDGLYKLTVEHNLSPKQIREIGELPSVVIEAANNHEINEDQLLLISRVSDKGRILELLEDARNGELNPSDVEPEIDFIPKSKENPAYNPTSGTDWDPEIERIEEEFKERLNASTYIKNGKTGGGQIRISYKDRAELERILSVIPTQKS